VVVLVAETPIVAQPIVSNVIHAPGGGVIVLDMLDNNRYGGTLADGAYGEVEISAASVASAQQLIQQVFDAFSWRGPVNMDLPNSPLVAGMRCMRGDDSVSGSAIGYFPSCMRSPRLSSCPRPVGRQIERCPLLLGHSVGGI
jgi:hypothetical protein